MDLRARQRAATREQIVDAVHQVLTEEHPATLSMSQVAARAGTSLRTLYRYFPTKEALVDAASETFRTPLSTAGEHLNAASVGDLLVAQWRGFTESIGAIRAQHLTPAGRALRASRLPRNRDVARAGVQQMRLDLAAEDEERLVDLLVAMSSSSMYLELVDRLGHDADEAARLAAWALGAIIERVQREGALAP